MLQYFSIETTTYYTDHFVFFYIKPYISDNNIFYQITLNHFLFKIIDKLFYNFTFFYKLYQRRVNTCRKRLTNVTYLFYSASKQQVCLHEIHDDYMCKAGKALNDKTVSCDPFRQSKL